ncbi:MAG: universal stress protein [Desulfobacterales bacterium]|nr:universal stress protein [Desulfobacterales bacterium]MBS3755114.1 universal stress protein [Desulfobacterales bacterium]
MFDRILLATSATEACDHAARVAFNMAERYKSYLNIFHVLGLPTRAYSQDVIDVKTRERVTADEEYIAWVKEEIRGYYERLLEKTGENYGIEVAVGAPHREILRAARNNDPDLIVMGGSTGHMEDSAYKKTTAGSTFQRVARAAHCPVLVVTRPAASFWGGFSRIVLGTDFSEASDVAFEYALQLARALDCELFLFHAVDISAMAMGKVMAQDDIEENLRVARRRMRSRYVPKMPDFESYTMDAWEGLPYVEITKYAREKQADLIVMAHHARRDVSEKVPMGSTMEQVIVRAACPVLSINRGVKK